MPKPNPQNEAPEREQRMRGRIAPGSRLDVRDQARLYQEAMGLEAAKRQAALARAERRRHKGKA